MEYCWNGTDRGKLEYVWNIVGMVLTGENWSTRGGGKDCQNVDFSHHKSHMY